MKLPLSAYFRRLTSREEAELVFRDLNRRIFWHELALIEARHVHDAMLEKATFVQEVMALPSEPKGSKS
jgi:hypothetical protein